MELDRISNFPKEITEKILSCLSLKEAVRTSILSTNWRYKSARLQNLVFDDKFESTETFSNIVDHVLLLHIGPIHKFKLSRHVLLPSSDIDRWVVHLSRNSIQEFVFDHFMKGGGARYRVPSCLFSCQDIIHLELFKCWLNPPNKFKGFRSLKRLYLQKVTLAQDFLDSLIGCSPLLERLKLRYCNGFTKLNISAPNLQFINAVGAFEDVNLDNTSSLAEVYIDITKNVDLRGVPGSSSNLFKFFYHVPHIKRLTIRGFFLKYLAVGAMPLPNSGLCLPTDFETFLRVRREKLPKVCLALNFVYVFMNFNSLIENLATLCLLRSSPGLQELDIWADHQEYQDVVEEVKLLIYDIQSCQFNQLRLVKISNIRGLKLELDFIKFLLLSSPVLERLMVKPAKNCSPDLFKELLRFRRDSKYAEIIYLDP